MELWKLARITNCLARSQLAKLPSSPSALTPSFSDFWVTRKAALHVALYLGILWDVSGHQLEGSKWKEHVYSCSIDPAKPLSPHKPSFYLIPGSADSLMLAFIVSPPPSFICFLIPLLSTHVHIKAHISVHVCLCVCVHTRSRTHTCQPLPHLLSPGIVKHLPLAKGPETSFTFSPPCALPMYGPNNKLCSVPNSASTIHELLNGLYPQLTANKDVVFVFPCVRSGIFQRGAGKAIS